MSQIRTGAVEVENNSALVTAADDAIDWTLVPVGAQFVVDDWDAPYFVGDVRPPLENVSGKWEISLTAPYGGPTDEAAAYSINIDISSLGFYLKGFGDHRPDLIDRQNIFRLEQLMSLVPGSGGSATTASSQIVLIEGALIGVMTIPVVFPAPLSAPPLLVHRPIFEKTTSEEDNVDATSVDSITRFGYNVNLSYPAIAGQKLHCSHVPPIT